MHVGIDLGTTFSLIARVDLHGTPVLFPDLYEAERFKTPSVVHISAEGVLVGQSVEVLLEDDPALPIVRFVKLKMGTSDPVFVDPQGNPWHAEGVSALILKKLRRDAGAHTDEPLDGAIIAVPAHFSDPQRRATMAAGQLAGFKVLQLIEEPLAAAVHYGVNAARPDSTLLVYDLGGGTFDATVMCVGKDGLRALATDGASDLGGKNIDEFIAGFIAEQFLMAHGYDPREDPIASVVLRRNAEVLKLKLAQPNKGQVRTTLLVGGRTQEVILTRDQLDRLSEPLIERSLEVCERTLKSAGLTWNSLDQVMMAGGSTLLPIVETTLRRVSQKTGDQVRRHQPHMAVAYGTALLAAQAAGNPAGDAPELVQRITGFNLGFRTIDKSGRCVVDTIIPRNTPIPVRRCVTYYTNRSDQRRIVLDVVQVQNPDDAPTSLERFAFAIDSPAAGHPIEVSLGYDEQGMVTVVARDPRSGREMKRELLGTSQPDQVRLASDRELVERAVFCG